MATGISTAVLLLVGASWPLLAAPFSVACSPSSVQAIARQIMGQQRKIEKLLFDSYMRMRVQGEIRTDRVISAMSAEGAFLDYIHHADPQIEAFLDPGRFQLWFNASGAFVFKPFERIVARTGDEHSQRFWNNLYLQAIGWRPTTQLFQGKRSGLFLDEFFDEPQASDLSIDSMAATVNGLTTIRVVTPSKSDEFWLAPDMNFALVQRILVRGDGRRVRTTISSSEFCEVATGIWLPRRVICRNHLEREAANGELLEQLDADIEVTQLAVNEQIPPQAFVFKPPDGTMTMDVGHKPIAYQSGGEELLDIWGAWCATVMPVSIPRSVPRRLAAIPVVSVTLLAVTGLALTLGRRRPIKADVWQKSK